MKRHLLAALLALGVAFALAEVGVDGTVSSTTWTPTTTSVSQSVSAGNIYTMNLTATEQTYRWAGFLGNLTGTIVLRDAAGKDFYTWTITDPSGSVIYATENSGFDPANLQATTTSEAEGIYTYAASGTDKISNTYTGTGTLTRPNGASVANTPTATVGAWTNYLMKTAATPGSTADFAWAVVVNNDQTTYTGSGTVDYELLIPEDETSTGAGAATTYYFYVELA